MHYQELEIILELGEDYKIADGKITNKYRRQAQKLVGIKNPQTNGEQRKIRDKARKLKTSERKQQRARSKQLIQEINWLHNDTTH